MSINPIKIECFLCKQKFQFGPHAYDGRYISAWKISICHTCSSGNWDGIVPGTYPHLMQHLAASGIVATLNAKGWLDIPA